LLNFQGDHSTKIAGVTQCLLEIKKNDPKAKALVFSTVNILSNPLYL
jgi:hypothetical protein